MIHRLIRAMALAVVFASIAAVSPGTAQTTAGKEKDAVVAIVNGDVIHMSDLQLAYERLPEQYRAMPLGSIYPALLNGLVGGKLAFQAAHRDGLRNDPEHPKTMANIEERLLERLYMTRTIEARMTDEALQAEYERHITRVAGKEEVHARHILVETETEGQAVIDELAKGAEFAELAKTRSKGPSGPNGGDLGFFAKDEMVPPFAEAAFAMKAGESSTSPVKTDFGWHVILVVERRVGAPPAFAEVEKTVREELSKALSATVMQELNEGAVVQLFGPDGQPLAK